MSSHQELVRQVMTSGIEALELCYEPLRQFSSPRVYARTSLHVNSLELGRLTPQQYRYVVQRTDQAEHLFRRHLHKLLQKIPAFLAAPGPLFCFTVPAFGRSLKKGSLSTVIFEELTAHPKVSPSRICIELSADLLFEELEPLAAELQKIKDLGVQIALTEVGDPFCPLLRLHQLPFDLALLDPYPPTLVDTPEEEALEGLCEYIHALGKKLMAVELPPEAPLEHLERAGCDGYSIRGNIFPSPDFKEDGDAPDV